MHLDCHAAAEIIRHLAITVFPLLKEFVVVGRVREDNDPVVVLGSSTEKGDTSDVDLFDGLGDGRRRNASDCLVERVQVADYYRDRSDLLSLKVGLVRGNVPGEDTCIQRSGAKRNSQPDRRPNGGLPP